MWRLPLLCQDKLLRLLYPLQNTLFRWICDTTYILFTARGCICSLPVILFCMNPLLWVCVFFFLLNHFTALILITTICLCAKREIISFLVTKTDSEVWFRWLRGIATVALCFQTTTIISTFQLFSQHFVLFLKKIFLNVVLILLRTVETWSFQ